MQGYWNDPERTAEAIDADGWMHTGDLAVMADDGYVNIVGRIKDMVIRGGENIYPREVEEFLYTHPDVDDVQVIGVPDERYGEELMAWVKLRPGATVERGRPARLLPGPDRPLQGAPLRPLRRRLPDDRHRQGAEVPDARAVDRRPRAGPGGRDGVIVGPLVAAAVALGRRRCSSRPPASTDPAGAPIDLSDPAKKEIAMQLVSSAENSTLDWRAQYGYIEDIGDGRGYTAGIIGFCSGTGDMLDVVEAYTARRPGNVLAEYLPALRGGRRHRLARRTRSRLHRGLGGGGRGPAVPGGPGPRARPRRTSIPPSSTGSTTASRVLGQFIYYDAMVMHGDGDDEAASARSATSAWRRRRTPADGGDETDVPQRPSSTPGDEAMAMEEAHADTCRVDTPSRCSSTRATSTSTRRSTGRSTATRITSPPADHPPPLTRRFWYGSLAAGGQEPVQERRARAQGVEELAAVTSQVAPVNFRTPSTR